MAVLLVGVRGFEPPAPASRKQLTQIAATSNVAFSITYVSVHHPLFAGLCAVWVCFGVRCGNKWQRPWLLLPQHVEQRVRHYTSPVKTP